MQRLSVSVQEAASMIGVSKSHLHKMVNEGVIRSVALGHRKLIPMNELERFITLQGTEEFMMKKGAKSDDK